MSGLRKHFRLLRLDVLGTLCVLALPLVHVSGISAQQPIEREISGVPSCAACTIGLRHVVSLGRMEDEVSIMPFSRLAMDSQSRYLIAPLAVSGEIAVFDANADFVRTIGRSGQGPGELGNIRYVAVSQGDSVLVMDRTRLTLFTPDGSYVRSRLLPNGVQAFRFFVLDDGRVLVNNYWQSRAAFGLLNQTYDEVRFFGRTITALDMDSLQYQLAIDAAGDIVAAQVNYGYVIEVWDTTGTFKRRYTRDVEWFPPWEMEPIRPERERPSRSREPKPRVTGLHFDVTGRLWVSIVVPDPHWRDAPVGDYGRRLDTVIEVIEWPSGGLHASQRFDSPVTILPNGFLCSREELESGLLHCVVWMAELETG